MYGLSPSAGVFLPVSSQDLKTLKKQVLKEAYQTQIYGKQQRSIPKNPQVQSNQQNSTYLHSSRSVHILPIYNREGNNREEVKTMLQNSYENDIRKKSLQKQEERRKMLIEQNDMLGQIQKHQSKQYLKQVKAKQQYKLFLQDQIIRKHEQKNHSRKEQIISEKNRSNRKLGLMNKERSFKEYFSNVKSYRDNCSLQYVNYHQNLRKYQQQRANNQKRQLERQSLLMNKQLQQQNRMRLQKKKELKSVLQQQMQESQHIKSSQLRQFKNRGYVKSQMNLYNPISNPIDYKIDINNKYLLNQILKNKSMEQFSVVPTISS